MRLISLALLLLALASAASDIQDDKIYYQKNTFEMTAGTDRVVSVQLPASGGKASKIHYVVISCSVACGVSMDHDGAPATGSFTILQPSSKNRTDTKLRGYDPSNAGAGTLIRAFTVPGGGIDYTVRLLGMLLPNDGDQSNFNLRFTGFNGTVNYMIIAEYGI
jgi:hypothetical protein